MRTLLLVFCALLIVNLSLEAKAKRRTPAAQTTATAKQHQKALKKYQKSRKAPKHRQKVN